MTWLEDLSPCTVIARNLESLLAIGWLGSGRPYTTGTSSLEFFDKLKALTADPFQPSVFMGMFQCELCQFDPPSGSKNLFIPGEGRIFVAPELIVHYVAAHHYKPPDEFIKATLDCPPMESMAYKKKFLDNGGRDFMRTLRG